MKKLIRICIIFMIFAILLYSAQESLPRKKLTLIIAIDCSKSVRKFWIEIQGAIFALIDELEPGDIVYPISFGTYAQILHTPIEIQDGREKSLLREIFSELKPNQDWTFFSHLLDTAQSITQNEKEAVLLVISDMESSPGPGRIGDIDLTMLSHEGKMIPGGGVFLIRILANQKKHETSVLKQIRDDEAQLKKRGILSVSTENRNLICLVRELIPLIQQNLKTAEEYFENQSVSNKIKTPPLNQAGISSALKNGGKEKQNKPETKPPINPSPPRLEKKASLSLLKIKEFFLNRNASETKTSPFFLFFSLVMLLSAIGGTILLKGKKTKDKFSFFCFKIQGDDLGLREVPLYFAKKTKKKCGPKGDIIIKRDEWDLPPVVFSLEFHKNQLFLLPSDNIQINGLDASNKNLVGIGDMVSIREEIQILIKGEESDEATY